MSSSSASHTPLDGLSEMSHSRCLAMKVPMLLVQLRVVFFDFDLDLCLLSLRYLLRLERNRSFQTTDTIIDSWAQTWVTFLAHHGHKPLKKAIAETPALCLVPRPPYLFGQHR